ncbi:MAG: metallophosphoesterase [Oscillospiraceae bacterium]|nr:metallophosphoesterase [Oscillospiraceae bacterium]
MKRFLRRVARVIAAILIISIVSVLVSAIVCARVIKTTRYDVALEGIQSPVRLVVVADIHGKEYGEDNARLYEKVAAQEPDGIVLLGDLFPSHAQKDDVAYVLRLTRGMQDIAQVYFALGNHETAYSAAYGDAWLDEIAATGAVVLNEDWQNIEIGGNTIRFGGTMGHGYLFGRTSAEFKAAPEYHVLYGLEHSPYPAILLSHMPDTVALSDGKERWHIPLVLCGHTHGGVIRVPFVGGIYAPMQGWWPTYDYGDMMLNDRMRMIITSGLSGHDTVPRIFNLPEIAVIDLHG